MSREARIKALDLAIKVGLDRPLEPGASASAALEIAKRFLDFLEPPFAVFEEDLADCCFSTFTENALRNLGIETLGDLLSWSESELLRGPGFGRKSLNEVNAVLEAKGLSLRLKGS